MSGYVLRPAARAAVEGRYAGDEMIELVRVGERRLTRQWHGYSQGTCDRIVRRSRSFGSGGASNRARNAA